MKRLFGFLLTATMLVSLCTFPTYALEEGSSQESIRVPQMFACSGSIEEAAEARAALSEKPLIDAGISPRVFISATYMNDGSAKLSANRMYDEYYAHIVTNIVTFPEGAKVDHVKGISGEVTKGTTWSLEGGISAPIKVLEASLSGSYNTTETITIRASDEFAVSYEEPGTYIAEFYMIGDTYYVEGNCRLETTDINNGKIENTIMGQVTFPTQGINMEITKR